MGKKEKSTPVRECELTEEDFNLCEKIVDHLEKLSYEELLETGRSVYGTDWRSWAEGVPYKPENWDGKPDSIKKYYYYSILGVLDERAGIKAVLRHKRADLTERQFEDWWDSVDEARLRKLEEKLQDGCRCTYCAQNERNNGKYYGRTIFFFVLGILEGFAVACGFFRLIG